ncbi:MAG: histidinol dehydrogenase [Chloroflexota bacterium]|nr:MAG: histidinol dehydrogenase [Chloroflexota bacterium]
MKIIRGADAARTTILKRVLWENVPPAPATQQRLREIFGRDVTPDQAVDLIIQQVRADGDAALRDLAKRIDGETIAELIVDPATIAAARAQLPAELLSSLELIAERVRQFHVQQMHKTWLTFSDGAMGQIWRAIDRVGIYVPGGTAAYPSTVLMTAIPARVAGVKEIVLCTPAKNGRVPASILAAAEMARVDRIVMTGGAQAIAALAFGTESVPAVDKIVGPGNLFVVIAKKKVFGVVGIDGLPGPTETVVIADDTADPAYCAADLLAQAEHDVLASAILITPSETFAGQVSDEVDRQMAMLDRSEIMAQSLENRGGIVLVESIEEAIDLANEYAPEHLELIVADGWSYLDRIRHTGGIFLGEWSPEALGDYAAGPSHVMPTGRTARFTSPLGTLDFLKSTSFVAVSGNAFDALAPAAALLARSEGLTAHANALELRMRGRQDKIQRDK